LPLFKTLYYSWEADTGLDEEPAESTDNKVETGTCMSTKRKEVTRNHPNISDEEVVSLLFFSDAEREHVGSTTSKQWHGEEWYLHKACFSFNVQKSLYQAGDTLQE